VKDVVGPGERDVDVMKDDREAHRAVRDIRKRESRPDVTATAQNGYVTSPIRQGGLSNKRLL
jgi:hypothetical protein